jgi:hypothetical protein
MDRAGFLEAVARERIRERAFTLEGGQPAERYVLSRESPGWSIYYSERGLRQDEHLFAEESGALDFLLHWLIEDPTTRERSI